MGNRLTKIYTRTGDAGTTGLANGDRASKADQTFVAMGDIDELNAHIGMINAHLIQLNNKLYNFESTNYEENKHLNKTSPANSEVTTKIKNLQEILSIIQHLLFNLGGELAMPSYKGIEDSHISWLENSIDDINQHLPNLKDFILPAGSILVSKIHIARTVCRRAERQAVLLKSKKNESISAKGLKLLNRLSDWLFVLARFCAKLEGSSEVLWNKQILKNI